jgi:hypothetical protein
MSSARPARSASSARRRHVVVDNETKDVRTMSHARFQKLQREKARQEKAAAKRDRRAARLDEAATPAQEELRAPDSESRVLAELEELHRKFDDGALDFDDFEERKSSLLAQLEV